MRDTVQESIGKQFATEASNLLGPKQRDSFQFFPLETRSLSSPAVVEASSNARDSSPAFVRLKALSRSFSFRGGGGTPGPKFVRLSASSRSLSFRGGGGTPSGFIHNHNVVALEAWIVPALTCALAYALYNISIKKASNDINPVLGGVILQFVAAILGSCVYLTTRHLGEDEAVDCNSLGVLWSVAAGVFVGLAEILSFLVNGRGVPATQSIPIIVGGSVLFGTALGRLLLGEDVSPRGWASVGLITMGIALVSTENPA